MKKKIFIIAGEASGDKIGGLVINSLQNLSDNNIELQGIGGEMMEKAGLKSIFLMNEISLMGFFEILPHIFKLRRLIDFTIQTIKEFEPDIVITIDSPGFCYRVVKALKSNIAIKFVHIVAPSVWAYKPERAAKFAAVYDLLLALLPIEPEYFLKEGLKTVFVGHFAFEQELCNDKEIFRKKYNIANDEKLICVTPGSRKGEIKRHLPIFAETIKLLQNDFRLSAVFLAVSNEVKDLLENALKQYGLKNIIVTSEDKFEAYKAADIALAKSGTNSFEISLHKTPQIIAYKMNWLSWQYIKFVALIKYATLINILAGTEIIPEFLQGKCKSDLLAKRISNLLQNPLQAQKQIENSEKILASLKHTDGTASMISTIEILKL